MNTMQPVTSRQKKGQQGTFWIVLMCLIVLSACDHRSLQELMNTAEAYEAKGDYQMANIVYDEMMTAYPEYEGSYVNKGVNLNWKDQHYGAIKVFKKGVKQVPESLLLHYNLATTYTQVEQLDSAIRYFTSALVFTKKCTPVSDKPQLMLVVSYEEESIESSEVLFLRGSCYFEQEEFDKCISDMKKCITYGYEMGVSYYLLGRSLYEMNEVEKGCEALFNATEYGILEAQEFLDAHCDERPKD